MMLRFVPLIICVVFMCVYLLSGEDVTAQELMNYAPGNPVYAAIFVVLLYAFKSLTVFFPIIVLNILGGFLFEPAHALIINSIGVIVELTIPYWIGRISGREFAIKIEKKHPRLAGVFGEKSGNLFFLSVFLRALFCLPGDAISMYFGAIKMPYFKYILGSFIGILPGTVAATFLGMSITDPGSPMFWVSVCLTVGFAILSFIVYYFWKKRNVKTLSPMRKRYIARLVGRCFVLVVCTVLLFIKPSEFEILNGLNFFKEFSLLHILWGIWVVDMVCQLIPVKTHLALGSQKLFRHRFRPNRDKINYPALKKYITSTTKAAGKVMVLWVALIAVIGSLYFAKVFDKKTLFWISVVFYVCDLICVLIWCPFRLILKNRCCTTCRIFNWDHLMMFSPIIFIGGFYAISLFVLAVAVWLVWELCILMYSERFWEFSNEALKCSNCTDKLCTQYCQKLRR